MLSICTSKCIYIVNSVWQNEEKKRQPHFHQLKVLILSREKKKEKESLKDTREMELKKV